MSVLVILTNVVVGVVQEVRAKRTLDRIALLTRPTAAVVRAGEVRQVAPEELVIGDLIELAAGGQVVHRIETTWLDSFETRAGTTLARWRGVVARERGGHRSASSPPRDGRVGAYL